MTYGIKDRASSTLLVLASLAFSWAAATSAEAGCVNHQWNSPQVVATNLYLNTSSVSGSVRTAATRGMGQWNSCNGSSDLPTITQSQPPSDFRQINLRMISGYNPTNDRVCGEFQGNEIRVYELARGDNMQPIPCSRSDILEDTIAHELGHAMGFGHPTSGGCSNYIMDNARFPNGSYVQRSVRQQECDTAAEMNFTQQECNDIMADNDTYNSPILIDLDRDQFQLTDQRVFFDIDADGKYEWTNWTAWDDDDALLAWDRNGNGVIDNGSELFGDATRFADGSVAPHGYAALAELDQPAHGGNGDGFITADDALFTELLLWTDVDHDGYSQAHELQPIASSPVLGLDLTYRTSSKVDAAGNLFLYHSHGWIESERRRLLKVRTVDVFFRGYDAE